jgi:type I restriction enzyme, S subunit
MSVSVWPLMKLDQFGEVARGKSRHRPRNDPRLFGGPYPFIQTADIMAADPYIVSYAQTLSEFGLAQSRLWPSDTLCITIAGANTARTAILKFNACFPDSIIGFRPNPSIANIYFVKYSLDFMKHRFLAVTRGATQDNLSLDKLLSFPIPTPPLETQRRIGGILSAYDDMIDANIRRIAILEEMARRLFEEWFVKFRFPDNHAVEFAQKDRQRAPVNWPRRPFSEATFVLSGGTPRKAEPSFWGGEIPFFTPSDARQRVFATETADRITAAGLNNCASQHFKPWTVFITARGTVGRVLMAATAMAINQSCYALQGKGGYPQTFVYEMACQAAEAFKQMAHGAVFDTIVKDTFDKHEVFLPPVSLAELYDRFSRPFYEGILVHLRQNSALRAARDLLVPKLISGDIDLSGAESQFERAADQVAAE